MKINGLIVLSLISLATAKGGVLYGTVKAQPKPESGERVGAGGGKYDSRQFKFVDTIKYDQIKDFIVYIDKPMTNSTFPAQTRDVITQKDAMFHPHVMPVIVGTQVRC